MGDERKVQQIISSLGDAIIADSGRLSRPRARVTAIAIAAAVLFALIAAAALYNWYQSYRALNTANAAISELVEMTSETVQPNAQLETVDALLEKARKAINTFAASNDPRIVEQRARTYLVMAQIDFDRGRIDRMQEDARTAFAKLHYDRGIADLAELLKGNADPKISWPWMRSLADLYQSLGDVLLFRFNQRDEALAAFNKAREQRERLAELGYQGPALEHDLAWITNKRAEVEERRGNIEEALKLFTEARDRMETLNDRIWDNLRWAADFGTVYANVARLKRKQNRFAEAAPIYGRAEEILSAVAKRDPKNVDRNASLNWIRFLRAENAFRLALQNSDRIRLLTAREQTQQVIATSTELMRETGQRAQAQLNKVREEALLAAIDANLRQLNGNYDSAALGFIEASDIIGNGYLKGSAKAPWPDLLRENIEYLEWAGGAYVKAQKPPEAQAMFKRAAEMLVKYREIFGAKEFEEFQKRIEARLDHGPPPASRTPAATERKLASPPAADRAPATTNATSPAASAPPAADPVPPAADVAPPADSAPPAPALKDSVSPPPQ
jgi:tetratricopeptide (TPR) repeat protein